MRPKVFNYDNDYVYSANKDEVREYNYYQKSDISNIKNLNSKTMVPNGNGKKMVRQRYVHFPNSITLSQTALATTNLLRFKDACGLFDDLQVGTSAATQEFNVTGSVSSDAVRKYLQSHTAVIKLINYKSDDTAQLANRIKMVNTSIDEQSGTYKIFDVAKDERNTQFQDTLQTVFPSKGEAYLSNTSGLLVPTPLGSGLYVELTLVFGEWLAYEDIIE